MLIPIVLLAILPVAQIDDDPAWSKEVVVRHGVERVVRYQARIAGEYLIVKAIHRDGWHTYAMDNELRAADALQGKTSLGIEQGTEVQVERGLELDGVWLQTEPQDLSKPELRWFTYGFDQTSLFACRVKNVNSGDVALRIRGQACSGETCCQVDVELKLLAVNPPSIAPTPSQAEQLQTLLKGLVPIKTRFRAAEQR